MTARKSDYIAAFMLANFVTAGLLVIFALPSQGVPTAIRHHHHPADDSDAADDAAPSGQEDQHGLHAADLTSFTGIGNMASLSMAGSFLGQENVRNAISHALTDDKTGPLLLRPMVQMLCAVIQQQQQQQGSSADVREDAAKECASDAAVKNVQKAIENLDFDQLANNPFALFDLLEDISHAVTTGHDDEEPTSSAGLHAGQPKLSELAAKKLFEADSPLAFQSKLFGGLQSVFATGKQEMAAMNETEALPAGVSIVQGAMRLVLTDRNLQKAAFEAACESHDIHSELAEYFSTKYGVMAEHQAAETIHDTIRSILANWEQRDVIFGFMKDAYAQLTGKDLPIGFQLYDGLVQGIKNGDIDLGAILGYMEMAKVNPAVIKALEDYDAKVFCRIKHMYVPAYQFIRAFLQEDTAAEAELEAY